MRDNEVARGHYCMTQSPPELTRTMEIRFEPSTRDHILVFAAWEYEPPYEPYGVDMEEDDAVAYFLQSEVGCHVLLDGDRVIGFATFGSDAQVPGGDYTASAVDIGLGIEPSLTGQGNGKHYVAAVVAFAQETFGTGTLRVSIAENNERALRVWSGRGFRRVDRFVADRPVLGADHFVVLELP